MRKRGPFERPRSPTKLEQGRCRTWDDLRALFERYGASPFLAARRAEHVMEGRRREKRFGRGRR